jgi:hypothetical protein
MTKAEALRRALGDLGKDAKPVQLQAHIKAKFGLDMTTAHISAAKTEIVRKMTGASKAVPAKAAARVTTVPKPARTSATPRRATDKAIPKKAVAAKPQAKPVPAPNGKAGGVVALADVQVVKALLGRVGPADLKTLIDVLAK